MSRIADTVKDRKRIFKKAARLCLAIAAKEYSGGCIVPEELGLNDEDYEEFLLALENLAEQLAGDTEPAWTTKGNLQLAKQYYADK